MSRSIFRILGLLCMLICYQHSSAQDALILARNFFNSRGLTQVDFNIVLLEGGKVEVYESEESKCFVAYVKNRNEYSLLGYSLENVFSDKENLDSTAQQLIHDFKPPRKIKSFQFDQQWPQMVEPLLTSKWSQGSFFNRYCPVELDVWHGRAWVGCVAVAMAQVVDYYGSTNSFVIEESYDAGKYGNLSVRSDGYDWTSLLDEPISYDLDVSRFLSDIGILVHTNYGAHGSSASTGRALKGFQELGYTNAYRVLPLDYAYSDWMNLIYSNLAEYSPIFVAGGGHAFVCDGYDENGFLHFNLGGGGIGNGYYSTAVIQGYTVQEAIVGLSPDLSLDPPESLSCENNGSLPLLTWSKPKDNQDARCRIYLDNILVAETSDTSYRFQDHAAGEFYASVSMVDNGVESKHAGRACIRITGANIRVNDPEILRAIQEALGITNTGDQPIIAEADLVSIKSLEIKNPIDNTVIFNRFSNLQSLKLNCTKLNAEDLLFISNLAKLQYLQLENIDLLDLPDLRPIKKLVSLGIKNGIGGSVDILTTMPNLLSLEISNCADIQQISFQKLLNLEELKIEDCDLSGDSFVFAFPLLRSLTIANSKLSGFYPEKEHKYLQDLNLDNNGINDLVWLKYFPGLARLSVQNNNLTLLLVDSRLDYLYSLNVRGNSVTDVRLPFNLPSLHKVNLSDNKLVTVPGQLLSLEALKTLDLSVNRIQAFPAIASQYLIELSLSGNKLTHIPDFSNFTRLNKLDLSDNQFSDLYPLVKGGAAGQFYSLDVRNNPISLESFENHIDDLAKSIKEFSYPPKAQSLAPCFPGSGQDASISTNRFELSWHTGEHEESIAYEILIGQADSLKTVYTSQDQRSISAYFQKGQVYQWQVKSVLADTCFYSGVYKIRTMAGLELPFIDDFEKYPNLSGLSAISNYWRVSRGGGDVYKDAKIVSGEGSANSKVLHITQNSDITLDLDHLNVSVLKVFFKLKVLGSRSAHIVFENMDGLQMQLCFFDGLAEIWMNGSLIDIFDYPKNEWGDYELTILGKNNRIFLRRNQEAVFNSMWEFQGGTAHIDRIIFCPDYQNLSQEKTPADYYLDDVQIGSIGSSRIDDIEIQEFPEITIYPNPTSNFLNVKCLPGGFAAGELRIIRMDGTEVYHENLPLGASDARIEIQTIPTGLYLCQILFPGRSPFHCKIIIQSKTL